MHGYYGCGQASCRLYRTVFVCTEVTLLYNGKEKWKGKMDPTGIAFWICEELQLHFVESDETSGWSGLEVHG